MKHEIMAEEHLLEVTCITNQKHEEKTDILHFLPTVTSLPRLCYSRPIDSYKSNGAVVLFSVYIKAQGETQMQTQEAEVQDVY